MSNRLMPSFLLPLDASLSDALRRAERDDDAKPSLADLERAFSITRDRVAAAENHLAAVTAELDGIEAMIATRVQAIGLRHHKIAAK